MHLSVVIRCVGNVSLWHCLESVLLYGVLERLVYGIVLSLLLYGVLERLVCGIVLSLCCYTVCWKG